MASKTWTPRRIRSEDERGSGSSEYMSLDEGEKFLGNALFEGNPAEDETGYYEYLEHWHQGTKRSIPCAGDDCPMCEEGDRPRTRAKSLWLVTKDQKGTELDPPKLMTFNLNYNLIKQFTEMRGEGDKIKGRQFRVSKLDDRGNHSLMPKTEILKATEIKALLKSKEAPDFEQAVTGQLRKAMEGFAIARALDDDDEEDEPANTTRAKKAPAKAAKAKKSEDWPEEGEDLEVSVMEVDAENWIMVGASDYDEDAKVWGTVDLDLTDLEEGDDITISYITDDEDDKVATAFEKPEAEEPEEETPAKSKKKPAPEPDENDLPDEIEDEEFVVVATDASEDTMEVKNDELEFTLYFIEGVNVDMDDYEPGAKIKVSAEKDSIGDLVATEVPEIVKAKRGRPAKAAAGKGKGR